MIKKFLIVPLTAALLLTLPCPAFSEPPAQVSVRASVQSYDQLLHAIREVRLERQKKIEKAVNWEKVREAWETGKLIDEHILQHKERADYGEKILERLAVDLGTSSRELHYMLKFFRIYPIVTPASQLSWAHYRELLSLKDTEIRKKVEDEAVHQHWSRDRVRAEVHARQSRSSSSNVEKFLSAIPGKINTYRVVKATVGPYASELCLDLGFSNYFQPNGIGQFNEGDVVTVESGKLFSHEFPRPREADLFTYTAYVTEVIDGDTFHAVVDLGFKIVTQQKLRLRGLDAPEIESADGREAKAFLEKHGVRPGARILVKTLKSDKYDRYLADVWVDGAYINQQLFDEGLAVMVSD